MKAHDVVRTLTMAALAATTLILATAGRAADETFSPHRLGAFSGAMKYCEARYLDDSKRYQIARLRVAKEVDGMASADKLAALGSSKRAYESGKFLGQKLDKEGCRNLLRASEWSRYQ